MDKPNKLDKVLRVALGVRMFLMCEGYFAKGIRGANPLFGSAVYKTSTSGLSFNRDNKCTWERYDNYVLWTGAEAGKGLRSDFDCHDSRMYYKGGWYMYPTDLLAFSQGAKRNA